MRFAYVLCLVLSFAAGCNQRPPPANELVLAPVSEPATRAFRLFTWNVHQGAGPDPHGRPWQWDQMQAVIAAEDPDVVFMQETVSGMDSTTGAFEVHHGAELAETLGGLVAFAPNDRYTNVYPDIGREASYWFGNATVSMLPFESFVSFPLSDIRTALVTFIGGVQFVNVHLTAADEEAEYQESMRLLKGIRLDVPTVIAGDFNARSFGKAMSVYDRAGFTDCASKRVDHVLVSPHFYCRDLMIEEDELSDHPRIAVDIVPR